MDRASFTTFQVELRESRWRSFRALFGVRALGFGGRIPFLILLAFCTIAAPFALFVRHVTGVANWMAWSACVLGLLIVVVLAIDMRRITGSVRSHVVLCRAGPDGIQFRGGLRDVDIAWSDVVEYIRDAERVTLFTRDRVMARIDRDACTDAQWLALTQWIEGHIAAKRVRVASLLRANLVAVGIALFCGGSVSFAEAVLHGRVPESALPAEMRGTFEMTAARSLADRGASEPEWITQSRGKGFYFAAASVAHDLPWLSWPRNCASATYVVLPIPSETRLPSYGTVVARVEVRCASRPDPLVFDLTDRRHVLYEHDGWTLVFEWSS